MKPQEIVFYGGLFLAKIKTLLGIERPDDVMHDLVYRRNSQAAFASGILVCLVQLFMLGDGLTGRVRPPVGQLVSYAFMAVVGVAVVVLAGSYVRAGYPKDKQYLFQGFLDVYLVLCTIYGIYNATISHEILIFVLMLAGGACLFVMPPVGLINFTSLSYIAFHFISLRAVELPRTTTFMYWVSWFVVTYIGILRYQECRLAADVERELREASARDGLTRIQNRRALRERFPQIAAAEAVTVLMLDVDLFKEINDRYGHTVGDEVLMRVSDALVRAFGFESCYRFGGDEFACFVPDMDPQAFADRMAAVRSETASFLSSEVHQHINVSLSMGYVWGRPRDVDGLRGMLTMADENLYKVKTSGRGRSVGSEYHAAEEDAE